MPFLLLLFLTLVCLPEEWDRPFWHGDDPEHTSAVSARLTWLAVALVVAAARGIAGGVTRRLAAYPGHRERALRRYGRLRVYHVFLLLGVYALSLYVLGWGWTVQQLGGAELPGAEVLILAPFLVALVLSWVAFYDAERALHDASDDSGSEAFWSRGAYVAFHVRQNLALVFVPLLLLMLMKGVRHLFPEDTEGTVLATAIGGLAPLTVFVGMPWILRLVLGLKPLPPGPLRDRLEGAARRLKFRCSNILVWNTRGGMVNAMVAGIVPWVRYVLLTDRLMSELTPDEVEAVFGHEIGHVKHRHMLYYLGFLLVSLALVIALYSVVASWLAPYVPFVNKEAANKETPLQALPLMMMLGAYIFVVFGFLSRRCERQADVYGCRAVSCARPRCGGHAEGVELAPGGSGLCPTGIRIFIEALEKVARLNGISRDKPGWLSSWQHSTIARRVAFLQDVLADAALERRFQRRVALVKWGLFLGLLTALALLVGGAILREPAGKPHPQEEGPPAATGGLDSVTPHTAERTAPSE